MEDSPAFGASQVGGLPDVVPEGTLLNMVLKRMHRPRSCSYQLLLEHQRPSCIQGLRWVSAHRLSGQGQAPRTAGGPGLGERACFWGCGGSCWAGQWVKQLGRCARGWLTQLHRVRPCALVLASSRCGLGEGERDLSFVSPLCALRWVVVCSPGGEGRHV